MSVEVKVEFERECSRCYGSGYLFTTKSDNEPCERCRSTGRVATGLGEELLEFLEHQGFKPVPPIESGKGG